VIGYMIFFQNCSFKNHKEVCPFKKDKPLYA